MIRIMISCLLVVVMLTFASMAFPADSPQGVPPLQCNKAGDMSSQNKAVPFSNTDCGDYTCANNGTCCGDNTCCPSGYNLYCKNKSLCYTSVESAQRDCGNDYYVCSVPAN